MKIKQLLSALLVSAFACTALASCGSLIKDNAQNDAQNNAPISVASGALTYIGLRINPEIEMVTDENGVVVSANAVNTDGEVVLSTVELEGKTAEEAVVDFTETAVDLGYMDPEAGKDTVYVDVNSEKAELVETVEKTLSDKLMKFFEKKGIAGKVSKEVLDSYLAAATEWNVTPGHAKIIARVLSANPELTYDELLNLTVKDLLELLKADKHTDKIAADCRDDYKAAVKALKEEYKELFELREAIDDIEDDLEDAREEDADEDDKLTEEEIAALEAELAEKKAKAEALDKEFKEKLAALKAEFKISSEEARKEHKKEADDRKQAKQEGKKYEKPEHDDDDDDDDRDDKKPENKPENDDDDDDDRDNKKPENKPENDDDDDDDHKGKGDKNDKDGKGEKPEHNKDVNDNDEEDDD
ncbi:MAG: hypothetical protein E7678_01535 [Ruminococcaceae bacterium]|nr:hypothetical protein [Oscillospiraceae bacterium]